MSTPAPTASPPPTGLGRAGAAKSGAPPGELSFATLLQNDRARTAVAEGQNNEAQRRTSAEQRDERSDARLERGAQPAAKVDEQPEAAPQPGGQDPTVDPALQSPVPPAPAEPVSAPVAATTTPFADAVAVARAAVVAPVQAAQTPEAAPVAVAPAQGATAVADAPVQVPVDATAEQAAAPTVTQDATEQAPAQAVQPAAETEATTETDDTAPAAPAEDEAPVDEAKPRPGRSGDAPGQQAGHRGEDKADGNGPVNANAKDPNANANARAFETPSRTGVTPSRGVGGTESAPVIEPTAPAAPAPTAPATSAAPQTEAAPPASAPAPVRGATTLQHLARTVDAALQMGHARGITRARLQLNPAELGAIELHLRQTANGMTARVVAESPEAVAALQQASNDLRRSLEQAGITLTGLDIGARADQQAEQRASAGAFDASNRDDDRGGANGRGSGARSGDDAEPTLDQTIRARVPLPGGALVDVLA